jgi:hypothetical protein
MIKDFELIRLAFYLFSNFREIYSHFLSMSNAHKYSNLDFIPDFLCCALHRALIDQVAW